tara:strand:+ start:2207 stop:2794 length:588 start_codon:yes stop_codon:yes gene_type:complete
LKENTKKIALFGTSADPPTNGHKKIIEELSKVYNLVITYASNNPAKEHEENLIFRSLLLKTLINDFKNPKIFFDQELSSPWALTTIRKCKNKYNLSNIDFVIGSDLLKEIIDWKNIKELFKEVRLYVIPRVGYPIEANTLKLIKKYNGNFKISLFKIPKVSSSMIRERLDYSEFPKCLIPLIQKNNLYNKHKKRQ